MAPRRPPVDLSAPLPSSTSPPVTQADIQTVLAAIEDLNSRLPAEAEGRTAPAAVVTKADIAACVAAAIGDLGPRLSADMDGKVRAALDEVRSQLSDGEMLSGLARTLERNGQIVEAVSERMAVNNETLQILIGLLQSVADTHGRLDERVSRLAEAQSSALERLEAWKRDIPADITAALSQDAAKTTGEVAKLAERFTALEAGFEQQRTDLAAVREAVTTTGRSTAATLSGIGTALDGTSGGIRDLASDFIAFRKTAGRHHFDRKREAESIFSRLHLIFWPVLFVFAYDVYRFIWYRLLAP
ncbi:MAG: hypothetical protein OXK82_04320 [Deltaproteobacteria bacterium]|nr:hypothetical protein [Deltaproteobacteria bacterium]